MRSVALMLALIVCTPAIAQPLAVGDLARQAGVAGHISPWVEGGTASAIGATETLSRDLGNAPLGSATRPIAAGDNASTGPIPASISFILAAIGLLILSRGRHTDRI
ncbi:MAG: hypothetical protein AAFR44_04980 [Pseudomonadota bacterium]